MDGNVAGSSDAGVDRAYLDAYRSDIDRSVRHALRVAGFLRLAAAWVAVIVVLGDVAAVAAIWADDQDAGLQALGVGALALPPLLLLPLGAWALGSLLEVQAWKLDLAMLETSIADAVDGS